MIEKITSALLIGVGISLTVWSVWNARLERRSGYSSATPAPTGRVLPADGPGWVKPSVVLETTSKPEVRKIGDKYIIMFAP